MVDTATPHPYVPVAPLEKRPSGEYQPVEVRREAFAAVLDGIPLGAYDERILGWLADLDDPPCQTIASVMWRCRVAGLPHSDREWGVRFTLPGGDVTESPCPGEEYAREAARNMRRDRPGFAPVTVVWRDAERPAGPWNEVPETDERDDPDE